MKIGNTSLVCGSPSLARSGVMHFSSFTPRLFCALRQVKNSDNPSNTWIFRQSPVRHLHESNYGIELHPETMSLRPPLACHSVQTIDHVSPLRIPAHPT